MTESLTPVAAAAAAELDRRRTSAGLKEMYCVHSRAVAAAIEKRRPEALIIIATSREPRPETDDALAKAAAIETLKGPATENDIRDILYGGEPWYERQKARKRGTPPNQS